MKQIYEILDEVAKATSKTERIEILRKNVTTTLKNVLQGAYHPNVKFIFDEIPEYKKEVNIPPGMGYTSLDIELKRIYLFMQDNARVEPNLSFERKKQILVQMLEALEPKEAEVLANMLMKNLKTKGLNIELVNEAFPGLIYKG